MKTIKIEPAGTKEVEVTLGRFRLTNILRLSSINPTGCEYVPTAEGLALECGEKDHYYVIAYIGHDNKEGVCDMRTVGSRFHQEVTNYKDWVNVKTLIKMAYDIILATDNIED